jgi:cysteinyl-tRNA synthetase
MTVRIYDTLDRAKVELTQRDPGRVSMYVCGPTVYDVPHVGHGRTALVYDVIRRYLEWCGLEVMFVSNVTDVEDKIIARAAEAGSTEPEIAKQFEVAYWTEMDRLGVRRPDAMPRATEYIAPMLDLIGQLVTDGHAYAVDGQGVYFDVVSFPGYGALPHRSLEQLLESAGARVEVDEAKRSAVDFALWKAAKPGEPAWDSPWGLGRPGWHIECSAMSLDLLGDGFDLHGAGDDLVFPHNENERAQAEGAGHAFARHWIHSGMVEISGEKMSKSLGNFRTLAEALDAHGPRAFRLAVLQTHYRKAMELGDDELTTAARGVARLDALARRARGAGIDPAGAPIDDDRRERFAQSMNDDFGTPGATAVVFDSVSSANQAIDAGDTSGAASLLATVTELAGALGLSIAAGTGDDAGIDALVAERDAARAGLDFATGDRIRDELADLGVTLEDGAAGTIWHRAGSAASERSE